jgi:Mn2+/Fe2+ NRAMP family transporter
MVELIILAWWLIGVGLFLYILGDDINQISFFSSLLMGVLGPIWLLAFLLTINDRKIWKK